ncbi:MAG: hypothetical protein LBU79_02310 [Planctomycetota bacterium]|jgi:hypothetical protein|nr:hypothetical protein [Planctomycetota bacterium]
MSGTNTSRGPVIAMWIVMLIGWFFFLLPIPGTIFFAIPFNFVAFILAIVCLIKGRVGHGLLGLIGSIIISAVLYFLSFTLAIATIQELSEPNNTGEAISTDKL